MTASAVAIIDPYFRAQLNALKPASIRDTKAMIGDAALKLLDGRSAKQHPNDSIGNVSKNVTRHSVPPHNDSEYIDEEKEMSSASVVRKFPSAAERITKAYTAERVKIALQAWGKDRASPIKGVQKIAKVDRKTAEAWWHGRYPPQTDNLFTLARKIPELKAECRRLLELEQDHAESFQREAIALLQRYAK